MTARQNRKKPENTILENSKWHLGTVTHDGRTLAEKGIKSPSKDSVIAIAFIKKERREVWFTSQERIKIFRNECIHPF